jgi:hypothetical protein
MSTTTPQLFPSVSQELLGLRRRVCDLTDIRDHATVFWCHRTSWSSAPPHLHAGVRSAFGLPCHHQKPSLHGASTDSPRYPRSEPAYLELRDDESRCEELHAWLHPQLTVTMPQGHKPDLAMSPPIFQPLLATLCRVVSASDIGQAISPDQIDNKSSIACPLTGCQVALPVIHGDRLRLRPIRRRRVSEDRLV